MTLKKMLIGAGTGALAAAVVDLHAFLKWRSWQEAVAYNWSVASMRWAIGAVTGALSAAGLSSVVSE